eukprot:530861_1
MSSLVYLLVILSCLLYVMFANISSTTSNSSGFFWIASDYYNSSDYFKSESITCSAPFCHIVCDIKNGCQFLTVNTTSLLPTLRIVCNGANTCLGARFYVGKSVTVTCDGTGCDEPSIEIATKWDQTLNLEYHCDMSSSSIQGVCFGPDVYCADTGLNSRLTYANHLYAYTDIMPSDSFWSCSNYRCCPYGTGTITCSADVLCEIDCDVHSQSQSCNNHRIDATEATSLVLDCGVNGCQGSQIKCPTGANTSCNIRCPSDTSCEFAYVQTGTSEMYQLSLQCNGLNACQWMQLQLHSSKITKMNLNCSARYSCQAMNYNQRSKNELSSVTPIINYLDIGCTSYYACQYAIFAGLIASNVRIGCTSRAACGYAMVHLKPMSSNTKIRISCINPSISTSEYDAACRDASFNIHGTNNNGNQTNNISYLCGAYDCYRAVLNVSDLYSTDIQCSSSYGCSKTEIHTLRSDQLSVTCLDANDSRSGPCNIDCLNLDACTTNMTNITSQASDHDKFNINCNGPVYACGLEKYPRFYCIDPGVMRKLMWSRIYVHNYRMTPGCYGDCCLIQTNHSSANASPNPSTDAPSPSIANYVQKDESSRNSSATSSPNSSKNAPSISIIIVTVLVLLLTIITLGFYFKRRKQSTAIKLLQSNQSISGNALLSNSGSSTGFVKM